MSKSIETQLAVLVLGVEELQEMARGQMEESKKITKFVAKVEERHRQEDDLVIPKRVAAVERWQYGVMAISAIFTMGGYFVLSLIIDSSMQSGFTEYSRIVDVKIKTGIDAAFANKIFKEDK